MRNCFNQGRLLFPVAGGWPHWRTPMHNCFFCHRPCGGTGWDDYRICWYEPSRSGTAEIVEYAHRECVETARRAFDQGLAAKGGAR